MVSTRFALRVLYIPHLAAFVRDKGDKERDQMMMAVPSFEFVMKEELNYNPALFLPVGIDPVSDFYSISNIFFLNVVYEVYLLKDK